MATTNYGWTLPTVGGDSGTWGTVLNAALDAADASLNAVELKARAVITALGTTGGATALNLASNARYFTITPNATTTFSFSNVPSIGAAIGIMVRITNTSGHTISWPASVKWPGGSAPSLATAGTHLVALVTDDAGTTWRGNALLSFA